MGVAPIRATRPLRTDQRATTPGQAGSRGTRGAVQSWAMGWGPAAADRRCPAAQGCRRRVAAPPAPGACDRRGGRRDPRRAAVKPPGDRHASPPPATRGPRWRARHAPGRGLVPLGPGPRGRPRPRRRRGAVARARPPWLTAPSPCLLVGVPQHDGPPRRQAGVDRGVARRPWGSAGRLGAACHRLGGCLQARPGRVPPGAPTRARTGCPCGGRTWAR